MSTISIIAQLAWPQRSAPCLQAGHTVEVMSRDAAKARALAEQIGAARRQGRSALPRMGLAASASAVLLHHVENDGGRKPPAMTMSPSGQRRTSLSSRQLRSASASARALAASRLITSTVCPALEARPPIAAHAS